MEPWTGAQRAFAVKAFYKSGDSFVIAQRIWNQGYLKSEVVKAHTVQELKHQIQQEVKQIPVEMLQRVMSDVRKRLTECLERNGGHLNDVIFGK
jgi:hypothetical protein